MNLFKTTFYITIVAFFCTLGVQAQSFVKVQGKATDITVSPKDGAVYVVGTSKNIFQYNTSSKRFTPFGDQTKNVKSIAVTKTGQVIMLANDNKIYQNSNNEWSRVSGDVRMGSNIINVSQYDRIRIVDTYGKIRYRYRASWELENPQPATDVKNVLGIGAYEYYVQLLDNSFEHYQKGKRRRLSGNPLQIKNDIKTNTIYAVGRNRGIYRYNKRNDTWSLLEGTRKDFSSVAVYNGKIWGITTDKSIYYYDNSTKKENPIDYSGTYRVTYKQIGTKKDAPIYGNMGVYLEAKTASGNISIKPTGNRPNRVWEIAKNSTQRGKSEEFSVSEYLRQDGIKKVNKRWGSTIIIDIAREFRLVGEAANKDATFDFQMNINEDLAFGKDIGGWERVKLKITDLKLNKVYYYHHIGTDTAIGFKIEKL